MKELVIFGSQLTCKVDDEDYDNYNKLKHSFSTGGYIKNSKGLLHRLIINASQNDIVDHINNNKLDNQKKNLRIVSYSQNSQNRTKQNNCSSKFIGVSFDKQSKKWRCSIRINNFQKKYTFENEIHAAYWYDYLALKHYGEYAKINSIDKPNEFIEPVEKINRFPVGISMSQSGKYIVKLNNKHIGLFESLDEAVKLYNEEKQKDLNTKLMKKINKPICRNKENIAIIKIGKNEILINDDKYNELVKYTWHIGSGGYAQTRINNKIIKMHRFLLNAQNGEIVDHINNCIFDNRIENLRISNKLNNSHNKIKQEGMTSEYRGVSFYKKTNKFKAQISHDKIKYYLGYFNTPKEAAIAYNNKAVELYGNFAKLNIISNI